MVIFLEPFIEVRQVIKAAGVCGLGNFLALAEEKGRLPDPVLV